jgi:hypothetical protein
MMWRGGEVSPVASPSTFGVAVCDGRSWPRATSRVVRTFIRSWASLRHALSGD